MTILINITKPVLLYIGPITPLLVAAHLMKMMMLVVLLCEDTASSSAI